MENKRYYYWQKDCVISGFYPNFNDKNSLKLLSAAGVLETSRFREISLDEAKVAALQMKAHYVYGDFTTARNKIIGCGDLLAYQKNARLEGKQISMMKNKNKLTIV